MDFAETLHGDGDRDDHLATVIDAHHAALLATEGLRDFLIVLAVFRSQLAIERQVAAIEPGPDRNHRPLGETGLPGGGRLQFKALHIAAAVEATAVENE